MKAYIVTYDIKQDNSSQLCGRSKEREVVVEMLGRAIEWGDHPNIPIRAHDHDGTFA